MSWICDATWCRRRVEPGRLISLKGWEADQLHFCTPACLLSWLGEQMVVGNPPKKTLLEAILGELRGLADKLSAEADTTPEPEPAPAPAPVQAAPTPSAAPVAAPANAQSVPESTSDRLRRLMQFSRLPK